MTTLKRSIEYLKDNPSGYWFKRKLYGWGWTPARWQGWLVILLFIAFLLGNAFWLGEEPSQGELVWFSLRTIFAIVVIIGICYKTGEKPRWQWGLPNEEKEKDSH